jgi:CelD/BcsL family acetyltransferase involved in cellulose biosynthesis
MNEMTVAEKKGNSDKKKKMDIQIRVVTEDGIFDSLKDEWSSLAERAAGDIFQTFEWHRTWWKHFGKKGDLYLVLFYSEGKLAGIAPLFWDRIRVFGRTVCTVLRFTGSMVSQHASKPFTGLRDRPDSLDTATYQDFIVEKGYEKKVSEQFVRHIKGEGLSYDELLLEEVPQNSTILRFVLPLLKNQRNQEVIVSDGVSCVQILLENDWEEYLKNLSRNSRKKQRRYLKQITDGDKRRFILHYAKNVQELESSYESLVNLHQKQWNLQGNPGLFYKSEVTRFLNELSLEFFKRGWIDIKQLTIVNSDGFVAADLYYLYKNKVYSIICGMDNWSDINTSGAGNVIFAAAVKEAIENGYDVFDYMEGLHGYKLKRGSIVVTNKNILIRPPDFNKRSFRISLVKTFVGLQCRLKRELVQLSIFIKQDGYSDGIKKYFSFISDRITKKSDSKNESSI